MIQSPNPLISIITVTFNNHEVTKDFLKSLKGLKYQNIEVIVVDNASIHNPESEYKDVYPNVNFIRSEKNLGFAGGNNLGIHASKGELLFFVNNDTELDPNIFAGMIEVFQNHNDAGAVSPKFRYFFHPDIIEYAGYEKVSALTGKNKMVGCREIDKGQYDSLKPTNYTHGGGMMVPKKIIDKIGEMPEVFFLYYEEFDWCEKILRAGYKIYYQPKSLIYHKESMSVGKSNTLKTYFLNRNRILFMRRNRNFSELLLFTFYYTFFTLPFNVLKYTVKGDLKHLKAFLNGIKWNITQHSVKNL